MQGEGVWRATGYAETPEGQRFVARKRKQQGDAIKALDAAIEALENPRPKPNTTTLRAYAEDWLETTARANVSQRTLERYEGEIRLHIVPALGSVPLVDLSAADVRRFKQGMMDADYAPSTVSHAHGVLSTILNQAVADGAMPSNPASLVKKVRDKKRLRTLSSEQAARLVESVAGTRQEALYLVALKLGPRPGSYQPSFGRTWISLGVLS